MGTVNRLRVNELVTTGTVRHFKSLKLQKWNLRIWGKCHKIENVSQFENKA
jgi:hypothetical protein